MAQSQTPIPPGHKTARALKQDRYTMVDVRSGMALDLSGVDHRSLIAFRLHGGENQQWEFRTCGAGFVIRSIYDSNLFLTLRDLKGLQLEGSAQIVTETFPTCWEVEFTTDNGGVPGLEDESLDDYGREVYVRIQLPHSDNISVGFKGSHEGAPLFLAKEGLGMGTCWRLHPLGLRCGESEQVIQNVPITTSETVVQGGGGAAMTVITTTTTTSTTRTVTRIVSGGFS